MGCHVSKATLPVADQNNASAENGSSVSLAKADDLNLDVNSFHEPTLKDSDTTRSPTPRSTDSEDKTTTAGSDSDSTQRGDPCIRIKTKPDDLVAVSSNGQARHSPSVTEAKKGFVAFDIPLDGSQDAMLDNILKRPLPKRLKHLEPLGNAPHITSELLMEKLGKAEEKRRKALARWKEQSAKRRDLKSQDGSTKRFDQGGDGHLQDPLSTQNSQNAQPQPPQLKEQILVDEQPLQSPLLNASAEGEVTEDLKFSQTMGTISENGDLSSLDETAVESGTCSWDTSQLDQRAKRPSPIISKPTLQAIKSCETESNHVTIVNINYEGSPRSQSQNKNNNNSVSTRISKQSRMSAENMVWIPDAAASVTLDAQLTAKQNFTLLHNRLVGSAHLQSVQEEDEEELDSESAGDNTDDYEGFDDESGEIYPGEILSRYIQND